MSASLLRRVSNRGLHLLAERRRLSYGDELGPEVRIRRANLEDMECGFRLSGLS